MNEKRLQCVGIYRRDPPRVFHVSVYPGLPQTQGNCFLIALACGGRTFREWVIATRTAYENKGDQREPGFAGQNPMKCSTIKPRDQ